MSEASELDLSAVPLFPLPTVVLFPRAVLPLHIFEDRYRAMTADALDGDRLIAMALLREGWQKSYYGKPAIEQVVCVGKILSHEKLADGKYNFLLEGVARARVVQELPVEVGYRIAQLQRIEDIPDKFDSVSRLKEKFLKLFETPPLSESPIGKQLPSMLEREWRIEEIADLAAYTLIEDVALKQSILAEAHASARVSHTLAALEWLANSASRSKMHRTHQDPNFN